MTVLALDVTADDALEQLRAVAHAPQVLINNAGMGAFGSALEQDPAAQARVIRLNCEALTVLTLGLLPGMVARGSGVILNLGSIAGLQPVPYFSVYGATKAYVQSLSEALDEELQGTGVRVAVVCPGPVPTEFQGISGSPDAMHTPSRARRSPEQIAEICLRTIQRPRRVVVPTLYHRFQHWIQRLVPRSWVVAIAGRKMRKRGV